MFDPVAENPLPGQHVVPPLPVEVDCKEEYHSLGIKDSHI